MKKVYNLILMFMLVSISLWSQREVIIPASTDPLTPTDIFPIISGDTTATGERNDNNTIYKLENNEVYITSGRLENTPSWPIHIEAVDLDDIDNKPIITRIPRNDGTYTQVLWAGGDVTLKNLWIISAETGPLELHQWGSIRLFGEGSRVIVDHCIMEKDRGGFLQFRAVGVKAYITNSVLRNGGNRRVFQGNGRGIDLRDNWVDTLIMRNTIVHNIQDRFLRSQGALVPHNYVEIDHCTSFNTAGRHGHIQLGKALKAKITNNIFMNPIMLGTTPRYTDEQTQPDNESHKVITIDSLYENTQLTISNNNVFWTQDILDVWAGIDSVSAPAVLSELIVQHLGDAVDNAFFSETIEFGSLPQNITQYVIDVYANPASEEMFDFIVEDISFAGTAFDSGNLFDFATFDACYSEDAISATAASNGGAIGATALCENLQVESDLRYVLIEASDDPFTPRDIFPVIMGDTTVTGERVSNNTIYLLENNEVYITSGRLENSPSWPIHIEAVDLDDIDNKPIITRIPRNDGTYTQLLWAGGDVTLKNLWIISAETGPLELHQWGSIRIFGEGSRVIVDHCIIEKDRGGFLQFRAVGVKAYITNSVLRNGGNRRVFQGNGRGIDLRDNWVDTLIMRNTIVHNIQDRFLRSQGALVPHNYVELDHCTSFNTAGRHGHIQLGKALKAKITNNIFMNPIMLGTTPRYTDEQTQPDNESHKVITIDSLYANTQLTISNNNVFWTQDILDVWAGIDSVSAPAVLSELIVQHLGDAAGNAFFSETIEFESLPQNITQYVIDVYANPASEEMFDFIVEDVTFAGTAFDSGNLFDFATFAPCYSSVTNSATAATDGGPIGAVTTCENLVSEVFDLPNDQTIQLKVNPNPVRDGIGFVEFSLGQSSDVVVLTHDISGKVLGQRFIQKLSSGDHRIELGFDRQYTPGLYFVSVATESGVMSTKVIVQ